MDLLRGLFKSSEKESDNLSFWEHLDVLRSVLLKIFVAVCVLMIIAFCFKEPLFQILLAPKDPNFIFYHLLGGEVSAEEDIVQALAKHIFKETGIISEDDYLEMFEKCSKIRKLLTASVKTAKSNKK